MDSSLARKTASDNFGKMSVYKRQILKARQEKTLDMIAGIA